MPGTPRVYTEQENGAYGFPLGHMFAVDSEPYGIEALKEDAILPQEYLEILAGIAKAAKIARETAPVRYLDKDGTYHLGTRADIEQLKQRDAITPEAAIKLKGIVEAFKGKISPDLEARLKQNGIKLV